MTEPAWVARVIIGIVLAFVGLLVIAPLVAVFGSAFADGAASYVRALGDAETLHALKISLIAVAIAMPLTVVFGVAAAWTIARFRFRGRSLLITLIDLPLSVSPVIAGLVFVLLLGPRSPIGGWLAAHGIEIIFAIPGIVLATMFVVFPYVARELIPLMESQGHEEEEAAIVLGATPWQMFVRVTLPKIAWGLAYGIVLTTARALGEFGAVSVVSGHIRGRTNTLPLHIDALHDESTSAAFAVASLLAVIGVVGLVARKVIGARIAKAGT